MKLRFLALTSFASLALMAGCASPASEDAESSTQDIVSATSAYTESSKEKPLDACAVSSEASPDGTRGRRFDCGKMGDLTLVAEQREQGTLAYIRTPTGNYSLDLDIALEQEHPGASKHGYFGKLAEWRGKGVALGQVEPKALILRYFFYERDSAGTFRDNNVLIVAKVSNYEACVARVVSGATPNHNQIARDIVDSPDFDMGSCGEQVPEPLAPTGCGTLAPYTGLMSDQSVSSCSKSHSLVMQSDGNLVLYNNRTGRPTWNSHTVTGKPNLWATMDNRGTLTLIDRDKFEFPFQVGVTGNEGASMAVQDDGNLVIYTKAGQPIWASGTAGK